MPSKPEPGSLAAEASREAVLNYQAGHIADRFKLTLVEARAFIDRFGLDRAALDQAIREQLLKPRNA